MQDLIGVCRNCLGCNRLEDSNFKGVYRCEYATVEQITWEQVVKEMKYEQGRKKKNS